MYKKLKGILFVFTLLFLLASCSEADRVQINTTLNFDTDFVGERVMDLSITKSSISENLGTDVETVKSILETNVPDELAFDLWEDDTTLNYTFYLKFDNYEEYYNDVKSILSANDTMPYGEIITCEIEHSLFKKSEIYSENFVSSDLLEWINIAFKEANLLNTSYNWFSNIDSTLVYNGTTYNKIELSYSESYTASNLYVDTFILPSGNLTRIVDISFTEENIEKTLENGFVIKDYLDDILSSDSKVEIFTDNEFTTYRITMENLPIETINNETNNLFATEKSNFTLTYSADDTMISRTVVDYSDELYIGYYVSSKDLGQSYFTSDTNYASTVYLVTDETYEYAPIRNQDTKGATNINYEAYPFTDLDLSYDNSFLWNIGFDNLYVDVFINKNEIALDLSLKTPLNVNEDVLTRFVNALDESMYYAMNTENVDIVKSVVDETDYSTYILSFSKDSPVNIVKSLNDFIDICTNHTNYPDNTITVTDMNDKNLFKNYKIYDIDISFGLLDVTNFNVKVNDNSSTSKVFSIKDNFIEKQVYVLEDESYHNVDSSILDYSVVIEVYDFIAIAYLIGFILLIIGLIIVVALNYKTWIISMKNSKLGKTEPILIESSEQKIISNGEKALATDATKAPTMQLDRAIDIDDEEDFI